MESEKIPDETSSKFGVPQAIFAGLAMIAIAIYLSFGNDPGPAQPRTTVLGGIDSVDDPVLGRDDAPVTIVEFSDFQCPFCRKFWRETLPQIETKYIDTGQIRFVYRDFPIASIHSAAELSAVAGGCAAEQGKFWQYHDKIFAEQDEQGTGKVDFAEADVRQWSAEVGLDMAEFDDCLTAGRYSDEVEADLEDGKNAGVTGTPTFFINGQRVEGAEDFRVFQGVIDAELKKR